ncbi:expressed unknown protein [Seminavis robusta]|uniref:Uncharacterized protein n=1 Tax=Seminavis robusta TaxID=568900 RepID=A0A9N8D6N9_9STRA|nr:expressed unknown protein [Seminavis robusta]|eukprot:Sro20_g014100.1 n/a (540) ;mRNA; r:82311-84021
MSDFSADDRQQYGDMMAFGMFLVLSTAMSCCTVLMCMNCYRCWDILKGLRDERERERRHLFFKASRAVDVQRAAQTDDGVLRLYIGSDSRKYPSLTKAIRMLDPSSNFRGVVLVMDLSRSRVSDDKRARDFFGAIGSVGNVQYLGIEAQGGVPGRVHVGHLTSLLMSFHESLTTLEIGGVQLNGNAYMLEEFVLALGCLRRLKKCVLKRRVRLDGDIDMSKVLGALSKLPRLSWLELHSPWWQRPSLRGFRPSSVSTDTFRGLLLRGNMETLSLGRIHCLDPVIDVVADCIQLSRGLRRLELGVYLDSTSASPPMFRLVRLVRALGDNSSLEELVFDIHCRLSSDYDLLSDLWTALGETLSTSPGSKLQHFKAKIPWRYFPLGGMGTRDVKTLVRLVEANSRLLSFEVATLRARLEEDADSVSLKVISRAQHLHEDIDMYIHLNRHGRKDLLEDPHKISMTQWTDTFEQLSKENLHCVHYYLDKFPWLLTPGHLDLQGGVLEESEALASTFELTGEKDHQESIDFYDIESGIDQLVTQL